MLDTIPNEEEMTALVGKFLYKEDIVSVNIAETFELLFDNNAAYKTLQKLQKENEKTNCIYFLIRID